MDVEQLDIEKELQAMTPEEKMRMLSGDGMWHTFGVGELPRVRMSDGPNGLRMTEGSSTSAIPSTCYPTASMLANSWDPALLYNIGVALGTEATAMGVNVLLAPGVNIKRSALCGRNFEYFSEDPLLAGTLGKAYIQGVQSTGVGACVKHFAANNQESYRMYADSVVDERALRELYLKPFEIALEAEPAAIMCAYNKLNGVYCSESEYLLKQVLRDEWHYAGLTVSDWGAVHNRAKSLAAGLDLEMPDSNGAFADGLNSALSSGEITEEMMDNSIRRTLNLIDNVYLEPYGDYDPDAHDKLSYAAAVESAVLLKNDNNFLPLTKDMKVTIMGARAESCAIQGGGSSHVTPLKSLTPLDAFRERAIEAEYCRGYSSNPKENKLLYEQAMTAATSSDAVIVYVGCPASSEGADRKNLDLPPEQDDLITGLTNAGHRVVVVLTAGAPVKMPWIKRVRSVLYAGLNGQNGALAAVDILYGRVNPRGKLAETFPLDEKEFGTDFGGYRTLYRESLFVGYKYYDAIKRGVLFPFGHGMSFSEITYDDMRVVRLGKNAFEINITLTNKSTRDAYEIVQIYVSDRTGRVLCPQKQLAGYCKVFVEGQTSVLTKIKLDESAFRFWNKDKNAFSVCDGEFRILAAASASDIKFEMSVKIDGDYTGKASFPAAYDVPLRSGITDADFAVLYGGDFPPERTPATKGNFTLDSCLDDIKGTFIGKIMGLVLKRRAKSAGAPGSPEREAFLASAMFTPLSAVASMSDGALSLKAAKGIILMANGHFFKGIATLLKKSE